MNRREFLGVAALATAAELNYRKGDYAAAGDGFAEEMLVMEALSSELLDAMRASGAAVSLKAVVTEHNVGWSAAQLCRELRREHEAMQRLRPKSQNRHPHKKRK